MFPKGDHKALLFYMREWGKIEGVKKTFRIFWGGQNGNLWYNSCKNPTNTGLDCTKYFG